MSRSNEDFYRDVLDPLTLETRVTNPKTGGQKGAKPQQFSLLPWDVLGKLAEHYGKGAAKYAAHNWRKGYDWSLSIDALCRHLAAFIEGETYDPETGSHHMLAVMFHAAALVYFTDAFPELDNRRNTRATNDAGQ